MFLRNRKNQNTAGVVGIRNHTDFCVTAATEIKKNIKTGVGTLCCGYHVAFMGIKDINKGRRQGVLSVHKVRYFDTSNYLIRYPTSVYIYTLRMRGQIGKQVMSRKPMMISAVNRWLSR